MTIELGQGSILVSLNKREKILPPSTRSPLCSYSLVLQKVLHLIGSTYSGSIVGQQTYLRRTLAQQRAQYSYVAALDRRVSPNSSSPQVPGRWTSMAQRIDILKHPWINHFAIKQNRRFFGWYRLRLSLNPLCRPVARLIFFAIDCLVQLRKSGLL